ncbi:MAG: ribosome recycling factor [candidate division KSB1 bacterium]|nr:ribosome recycling factor [candidate division KSB1 bacterium]
MIDSTKKDAKERMEKALETVRSDFAKLRTGKATPALLDGIRIDYYGTPTPLKQVANISAPEPRLLVVQPWERNMLAEIERAIIKSDLGFNPTNDGIVIRIPIPQLSEERRKELVKIAKKNAEEGRVAVRNIRRDVNERLKKAEKAGEISEDESRNAQEDIQKLTDEYIKKIDDLLASKEKEIMGQ